MSSSEDASSGEERETPLTDPASGTPEDPALTGAEPETAEEPRLADPSEEDALSVEDEDEDEAQEDEVGFAALPLDPRLLKQLVEMGFEKPTPIQLEAMPHLLAGRDIIGRARTGSGKTAAFGLPLLEQVKEGGRKVRALVLTPTRELAQQVGEAIRVHATGLPKVRGVTIYGGAPYPPQIKALKSGCSVVVGTPGRVIDLMERGSLDLSSLELFVLDEADEMLRMGFIEDVERLLAETPDSRQVALFSATMPPPIRKVASTYLSDPVEVQVEEKALSVGHIEQRWLLVPSRRKLDVLVRVLQGIPRDATLIFARTRASCTEVADELTRRGHPADSLHGDLSQSARERVLGRLRNGSLKLLVATDVAARGLDVNHLTHVINLDLPENREIYVHRIGRTGRAGRKGMAISLATPNQQHFMRHLEKSLGVVIARFPVPSDAQVVGHQRAQLAARLGEREEASVDSLRWGSELLEASDWSPEELAARALQLLADRDGVSLKPEDELDDQPPEWARKRTRPPRASRTDRGAGRPGGPGNPSRKGQYGQQRRSSGDDDFDRVNEVQIFVALGRRHGARPADLVGALANDGGLSGKSIGRIHITESASFVGLPRDVAEGLLERHGKLNIRGIDATIDMSKTRPPGEEPGVGGPGGKRPRRVGSRPVRPGLGAQGRSGGWKVSKAKSKVKSKVKSNKGKPQRSKDR